MLFTLPPEPLLDPEPSSLALAFNLAVGLSLFGLVVQEYMRVRAQRRLEAEARRAEAAERISAALQVLPGLEDGERRRACRAIVRDLRALVGMACYEITRCAFVFTLCQQEDEQDESEADHAPGQGMARAISEARREATAIHRRLELASVFLWLRTDRGQRLTLEAVDRYVRVFTPAVQQIHEKSPRWRRQIPLFEIQLPERDIFSSP